MLLTAKNLSEIKYKTKRVKLEKAEAEINVALIPTELIDEARTASQSGGDTNDVGMKILLASVVDDNGKPVFESVGSYESMPLAVRNEIMDAVFEYNGLDGDLEKN